MIAALNGGVVIPVVAFVAFVPLARLYRSWLNADLRTCDEWSAFDQAMERAVNRVHGRHWDG